MHCVEENRIEYSFIVTIHMYNEWLSPLVKWGQK